MDWLMWQEECPQTNLWAFTAETACECVSSGWKWIIILPVYADWAWCSLAVNRSSFSHMSKPDVCLLKWCTAYSSTTEVFDNTSWTGTWYDYKKKIIKQTMSIYFIPCTHLWVNGVVCLILSICIVWRYTQVNENIPSNCIQNVNMKKRGPDDKTNTQSVSECLRHENRLQLFT